MPTRAMNSLAGYRCKTTSDAAWLAQVIGMLWRVRGRLRYIEGSLPSAHSGTKPCDLHR